EVRYVHLDQVGPAVFRRELLEVDRGGDADRQRQHEDHDHHVGRAEDGDAEAGRLGPQFRGIGGCDETPVERYVDQPLVPQRVGQFQLFDRNVAVACGAGHGHAALEVTVDAAVGE